MLDWARMNGAVDTRPTQMVIPHIPPGYGEATWVTAEGLIEQLTGFNIFLI
jgi:hypothetical protein